jgi:hypothetical protein
VKNANFAVPGAKAGNKKACGCAHFSTTSFVPNDLIAFQLPSGPRGLPV